MLAFTVLSLQNNLVAIIFLSMYGYGSAQECIYRRYRSRVRMNPTGSLNSICPERTAETVHFGEGLRYRRYLTLETERDIPSLCASCCDPSAGASYNRVQGVDLKTLLMNSYCTIQLLILLSSLDRRDQSQLCCFFAQHTCLSSV